jgi:catechol 2,3-dioxygenase-like lactoylglutathione lyase family enzyme
MDLTMLAYITIGTNDLERAGRFYDAALAPLDRMSYLD